MPNLALAPQAPPRQPSRVPLRAVVDGPTIAELVSRCLRRAGYGSDIVADVALAVDAATRQVDGPSAARGRLEFGDLEIDPAGRRVRVGGADVRLTQREFDLLLFLARHPGQVFTREELMRTIWQYSFFTDTSTVTVHVRRLRAKLEVDPGDPRHVRTVWGIGYSFEP